MLDIFGTLLKDVHVHVPRQVQWFQWHVREDGRGRGGEREE